MNLGWNINTGLEPTNDINVGRAIILATDRAGFKKTILAPSEGKATSPLAAHVQGSIDQSGDALRYDPEEAKRLLDQAGWKVGPDGIRVKDRSRNDAAILNVNFNPTRTNGAQIPNNFPDRQRIIDTLEALDSTLDPTKRAELTKAAQILIQGEFALFDPVFEPSQVAASKGVHGIDLDATSRLHFLRTWINQR